MVVALVLIGELAFSGLLPSVRFSVGFYAGRMFSLITSSIVLILLLAETTRLYVRLARTNAMVQRERNNKLMNLEAMVASIAHEVRQPLSGITTSAAATLRFFKQAPPNIEKAESAVKMIVDASYRVSGIFDNILVLFGKGELPKEQVDLNRLALDALRDLDYECKKYSIVTSVELAAGLLPVMANEGQLREVVVNVVRNAIEAMESVKGPRTLKVTTELDVGDAVVIAVADTGPGLSPERADTIFDPFVTAKPGGMGLGLAICRMILDRHKGEISVSTAKPRGTIFRIALPGTGLPH
jgi:signal transduction histidine kinase